MILVADNAPYHHNRGIGLIGSKTKKQMVDLIHTHKVEYLDLPLTNDDRLNLMVSGDSGDEYFQDRGGCVRLGFDRDKKSQCASKKRQELPHWKNQKWVSSRLLQRTSLYY